MLTKEESWAKLKGVFTIVVTPFAPDGGLDFRGLAESIDRVAGLGADGVLIGGTYGEFPTMTPEERAELFQRAVAAARGRLPIMLCSAASDPRLAAELTRLAVELGGVPMVTAPFVSEVEDEHIVAFFRAIAPLAPAGLVIYNAPGIGITLAPQLIERLAEIDGIIGLKQGDLRPEVVDDLANRLGGRLRLFCASDLTFLGPLMAGFDGLSSTNSCAFPEIIFASFRALEHGDAAAARELHRRWYSYRVLARRFGQPQTVKAAMNARGWNGGTVRPPLLPLTAAQTAELEPVVRALVAP